MNYRCTTRNCRKRVTLRKWIEEYIQQPHCSACGGRLSYDPEPRRRTIRDTCRCDQIPYPHRSGTRFCIHSLEPMDELAYQDMINSLARRY